MIRNNVSTSDQNNGNIKSLTANEIIMIVNVDALTKSILPLSNLSSSDEENVNCIINVVCLNENHIVRIVRNYTNDSYSLNLFRNRENVRCAV